MTTPSEQWIVSALREATDRVPLPPESRWIRERRSTPSVSMILLVGVAAIIIVVAGMTIGALRIEPRLVPAAGGPSASESREDAQWRTARAALPSALVLLRPAWIPAEFRGSAVCPSPVVTVDPPPAVQGDRTSWVVRYQGRVLPNGGCAWLEYGAEPGSGHHSDPSLRDFECGRLDPCGPTVEIGTFDERGTTVHVRRLPRPDEVPEGATRRLLQNPGPTLFEFSVWWNESGAHYDVQSKGLELDDLLRVIRSLEPVQ